MVKVSETKAQDVWVDLTDLLAWRGAVTGVQRVVYEYAKRFELDGARFFIYSKVDDQFIEVNLLELNSDRAVTSDKIAPSPTFRRRIKNVIGIPYYKLSADRKANIAPYVNAVNHAVRSIMHHFVDSASEKFHRSSMYSHHPNAEFVKDDTIVLLGAGWNEGTVLDKLVEYKRVTNIRICQHMNDILPIYQPQLFSGELPGLFEPYVETVVKNADVVTVISQATKPNSTNV